MISGASPSVLHKKKTEKNRKKREELRIETRDRPYVLAIWLYNGPFKSAQWLEWVWRFRGSKSFEENYMKVHKTNDKK